MPTFTPRPAPTPELQRGRMRVVALSLPERLRRAWASVLLGLCGVRCGPRTARWLAAVSASPSSTGATADSGRRRLDEAGRTLALQATRASVGPRHAAQAALLPTLTQRAADAAAERARLEALLPVDALPEPTGVLVRALIAASLIGEGWLLYESLALVMTSSPVGVLISSLVAAPLAAVLMDRAGALVRGSVRRGRIGRTELALLGVLLACPAALGVGVALSRSAEATGGRLAALWVSAGLQAVLLTVPFVAGYNSAVPGLRAARRRQTRAAAALHRVQANLAAADAERAAADAEADQQRRTAIAAYDHWLRVYGVPADGADGRGDDRADNSATYDRSWHRARTEHGEIADAEWSLVPSAR